MPEICNRPAARQQQIGVNELCQLEIGLGLDQQFQVVQGVFNLVVTYLAQGIYQQGFILVINGVGGGAVCVDRSLPEPESGTSSIVMTSSRVTRLSFIAVIINLICIFLNN